jgi:mannose/fructose/N-acetylgalactosamine-specific phosphotransferase system component IIC
MGDLRTGLEVGVAVELMFLAMVFVGTAIPPEEVISCAIATAFSVMAGGDSKIGIATAIPIAMIGQIGRYVRMSAIHVWTNLRLEKCVELGKTPGGIIMYCTIVPAILSYILFGVPTFLAIYYGADVVQSIINFIPEKMILGISAGGGLIGAVGVALLLQSIKARHMWPFFLVGFFCVSYLKVNMIGIAIVAVVCVALHYHSTAVRTKAAG